MSVTVGGLDYNLTFEDAEDRDVVGASAKVKNYAIFQGFTGFVESVSYRSSGRLDKKFFAI